MYIGHGQHSIHLPSAFCQVRKLKKGDKQNVILLMHLTTGEFKNLVSKHLDRFDEGTVVRTWLASLD
jgi:hypothetical protein